MESEVGCLASAAKIEATKPKTAITSKGSLIRIIDLTGELTGFRGILSNLHARTMKQFGVKTLTRL